MKTVLIFIILFFVLLFDSSVSAQLPNDDSNEKIVVELYLLDEYAVGKNGDPLPTNIIVVANESKEFKELAGGGFATVECTNCPLSAEYDFFVWKVEKISSNETKIFFRVAFKHESKCNTDSSVTVKKDKVNTFNIKCRPKAKIIVRYKSLKTTNN